MAHKIHLRQTTGGKTACNACPGDTLTATRDGFTFTASLERDECPGTPWDNSDGHGPVTDWLTRDKLPGELLLQEGIATQKRFYDYQTACDIARRDDWGLAPHSLTYTDSTARNGLTQATAHYFDADNNLSAYTSDWCDDINDATAQVYAMHRATMSPAEYAAQAARQDYETLQAWIDDKWFYVTMSVTISRAGIDLATEYLGGLDCNYPRGNNSYLNECAQQLAEQALDAATAKIAELTVTDNA